MIKPEDHVLLAGVDSPEGTAAIEVIYLIHFNIVSFEVRSITSTILFGQN